MHYSLVLEPSLQPLAHTLVQQLYGLLRDTQKIFNIHKLTYWAAQNTTLGAMRHQGIIPWQKARLGLMIFDYDEDNFLELQSHLYSNNIYIKKHMVGWYKLYRPDSSVYDDEKESPWWFKHLPNIDLYVMQKMNTIYHFQSPFLRNYLANYYFTDYELKAPFKKNQFGETSVPLAHDSPTILNRTYGAHWKKVIR